VLLDVFHCPGKRIKRHLSGDDARGAGPGLSLETPRFSERRSRIIVDYDMPYDFPGLRRESANYRPETAPGVALRDREPIIIALSGD